MERHRTSIAVVLATCACVAANAADRAGIEQARAAISAKEFVAAARTLDPLAAAGDAQARYLLASLYRAGLGVAADTSKARALLTRAADDGLASAALALAESYASDEARDPAQALRWLERAATLGSAQARKMLTRGALPRGFAVEDVADGAARVAALQLAVRADDGRTAALLLDARTADTPSPFGRTLVAEAAANGACSTLGVLLERGAPADRADEFGITPLMLAADSGALACVELLLAAQGNADARDAVGNTALMRAARLQPANVALVQRLLDASRDRGARNAQGWSALDWAMTAGDERLIDMLRRSGMPLRGNAAASDESPAAPLRRASRSDLYRGWSDAQLATSRRSDRLLQALRGAHTPLDLSKVSLQPAIAASSDTLAELLATRSGDELIENVEWAVRHGTPQTVRLLIGSGVVGQARRAGAAPLGVAIRAHRPEIVSLLLDAGIDVHETDAAGRSLLMLAATSGSPALVDTLLAHLAPVDALDRRGRNALWYAASSGDARSVSALLAARCPVDVADRDGRTALAAAAARGDARIVRLLLEAGAARSATSPNSVSPLILAARSGDSATLVALVKGRLDLDAQDRNGDTALIVAARFGQVDAATELVRAGANRNIRNTDRMSALDVAAALSRTQIERLLTRD